MNRGSWDELERRGPMFGVFNDQGGLYALFVERDEAEKWIARNTTEAPDDERINVDLCVCEVHRVTGLIWNSYEPASALPDIDPFIVRRSMALALVLELAKEPCEAAFSDLSGLVGDLLNGAAADARPPAVCGAEKCLSCRARALAGRVAE